MFTEYIFDLKNLRKEKNTLSELENKINEIYRKQKYILDCNLSKDVTILAISELEEQKKKLLERMHKKVDEL